MEHPDGVVEDERAAELGVVEGARRLREIVEGVEQLVRRDRADGDELLADLATLRALQRQRLLHLVLRDDTAGDEKFSQLHAALPVKMTVQTYGTSTSPREATL